MTLEGRKILGVGKHDHSDPDAEGDILLPKRIEETILQFVGGDMEVLTDGSALDFRDVADGIDLLRIDTQGPVRVPSTNLDVAGGDLTVSGYVSAGGELRSGGNIVVPANSSIDAGDEGSLLFGGGTTGPSMTLASDPSSFIVFDNSSASAGKLVEIKTGGGAEYRTQIRVFPGATSPGSASNPVIKIGDSGAGIFVDSNGDLAGVNEDGTSGKLI